MQLKLKLNRVLCILIAAIFMSMIILPVSTVSAATITLPSGSTSADLQKAIDNAVSGDTIEISGNMEFLGTVTIPAGKEITIQSTSGNNWTMSRPSNGGRHFHVMGRLTLQNITIDGGKTGGGLQADAGSNLTINDGTIIQNCRNNNTSDPNGGGVSSSSRFIMNGGIITGNVSSARGGGIYTVSDFTMNGGTITGNTAWLGGGVYIADFGTINGGTISNNNADIGGGLYVTARLTITDITVSGNKATVGDGGGMHAYGGLITISGGTISGNTSTTKGGGIGIDGGGTFNLSNVIISGNTASGGNGGGIYMPAGATVNLSGSSTIANNSAPKGDGGGIYTENTETYGGLTTSAGTKFSGNTASAAYAPPSDASTKYPNIKFESTSITNHPLNNYDINYKGSELLYFHVNYDANGGTGSHTGPDVKPGKEDTVLTLADTGISYQGYTFTGWNTKPDGSGDSYAPGDKITLNKDVTLYAQWTQDKPVIPWWLWLVFAFILLAILVFLCFLFWRAADDDCHTRFLFW